MLSSFERSFIVGGIEQDFRSDGRSCQDYRHFEVETGIVSNTSGSARLRLVCTMINKHETDIDAKIKLT